MTQEAWGYGEWTSVSLPTRHMVYTMSRDDLEELDDLVRLDTSEDVDGSTVNGKAYVLPQPSAASGYRLPARRLLHRLDVGRLHDRPCHP